MMRALWDRRSNQIWKDEQKVLNEEMWYMIATDKVSILQCIFPLKYINYILQLLQLFCNIFLTIISFEILTGT